MKTRRQIQVADEIKEIVSVLLQRELKDPRIGFVTVTQVDVSNDFKYSKIFVSVMGTPEEKRETMAALTSSRGFIRRELASRMTIRFVPEVTFKLDQSIEHSDNINRLLNELKLAESERESTQPASEGQETTEDAATVGENSEEAPEEERRSRDADQE
jgi:ribosome-binding factor A